MSKRLDKKIEERLKDIRKEFKNQIEEICIKLLYELLNNEKDCKSILVMFPIPSLRKKIKDAVLEYVKKDLDKMIAQNTKHLIEGEDFIDNIINRINRKQLNVTITK